MAGKKEFSWDDEELVAEIPEGDKVINEIKKCTLNGKEYITVAKKAFVKGEWKYQKNSSFKRELWDQIVKAVK